MPSQRLLTLTVTGAKGISPLDRSFCFCGGSEGEGVGEDAALTMQFFPLGEDDGMIIYFSFPHHHLNFLPLPDVNSSHRTGL